jgi:3-deoxy-D-manno-octulosonate 8-phosphate phosphatase KdsC-like HAD superfamily phosphatase
MHCSTVLNFKKIIRRQNHELGISFLFHGQVNKQNFYETTEKTISITKLLKLCQ